MPVQFLSDSDHDRLNRFPQESTQTDLDRFFWLSPDDHRAILGLRGDHNRLGFALFLCCLRYLNVPFFSPYIHLTGHVLIFCIDVALKPRF
jgi:hypothetical protein